MGVRNDNERKQITPYNPFASKLPVPVAGIFDAPCTCVKINVEWRKYIYTLLDILDQPDIWATEDPDEIQALRDQVNELRASMATCGCAGGGRREGIAATINYRLNLLIEFTVNGLDGIAPTRPDTTFDTDSGDAGDDIQRRENALCNACLDYVNTAAEAMITDAEIIGLGAGGLGAGGIIFIINPIAGIILAAAAVLITSAIIILARQDDTRQQIACCMFEAMKGQVVSEANFQTSLDSCGFGGASDEEALRAVVAATLGDNGNWLAFVASLGGFFAASNHTISSCACNGPLLIEQSSGFPGITLEPVFENLGGGMWRITSGIYTHPTAGLTAFYQAERTGGGCFSVENIVKISGTLSRTSWKPCGGSPTFTDNPVPLNKANVETYANLNIGSTAGFVVEFDAVEP